MRTTLVGLLAFTGLALSGCRENPVRPPAPASPPAADASHADAGVLAALTGGGQTRGSGLVITFSLTNVQKAADGTASGQFRFSVVFQGELVEFHGRTTCLTVDPENDRAWVGGVITQNNSTHSFFTQDINEPGRDIWFRAVDYGEGANAAQVDRTTFVGFEGNAGIETSREYCDLQIWPEGDARTNPVTQGNLQLHVR